MNVSVSCFKFESELYMQWMTPWNYWEHGFHTQQAGLWDKISPHTRSALLALQAKLYLALCVKFTQHFYSLVLYTSMVHVVAPEDDTAPPHVANYALSLPSMCLVSTAINIHTIHNSMYQMWIYDLSTHQKGPVGSEDQNWLFATGGVKKTARIQGTLF